MDFSNFVTEEVVRPSLGFGTRNLGESIWYVYYIYTADSGVRASNIIFCKSGLDTDKKIEDIEARDSIVFITCGVCDKTDKSKIQRTLDKSMPYKSILQGE